VQRLRELQVLHTLREKWEDVRRLPESQLVGHMSEVLVDPQLSRLTRILWRMSGPKRVVTAALFSHPCGTELRVYFEPESAGDLLHSQVERFDIGVLEEKAALKARLDADGSWRLLPEVP